MKFGYRTLFCWILVCLGYVSTYAQTCVTCTANYTSINQGLVLCVPFNGGSSDDQSVYNFPGTAVNIPGSITDRNGIGFSAMQFNGTNQFVRMGNILDSVFGRQPASKFTVTGWAKTSALPVSPNIGIIVGKYAGSAGPNQWAVYQHGDGTIRGVVHSTNTTELLEWKSTTSITPNQWFFFVMMFDGTYPLQNSRITMYINTLPTTFSRMVGTIGTTTQSTFQHITIGAGHASASINQAVSPYNGAVDDVRIYNRLLTNAEIAEMYNGTPLQITPMPDIGLCLGDSAQLTAAGGTNYTWFPSANLSSTSIANPYVKPTTNRTYFVTITNGICSNRDTVVVSLNQNCCVLASSISSKNSNLLYYLPINNEAKDLSPSPAVVSAQGTGLSFENDRFGNKRSAYTFTNVSTDKLITSSVPKLSFGASQSFTISTWAKARTIRTIGSRIVSIFKNGGYDIVLSPSTPATNAGKLNFIDFEGATSTTKVSLLTDSAVRLNEWFHVAVTVSKSDSMNRIYLNGRLAGQVKSANSVQNACGITIGNHNLNPLGLDGAVDEVRVYNYSLDSSEVVDLYYKGRAKVLTPDTTICSGDSVQLSTYGQASSYSWTPTTGISDPTIANPVVYPMATTQYILTTVNGGCTFKDTVIVYVNYAEANAGIDTLICKGDSVKLKGSGGTSYLWSPASSMTGANTDTPYAKPSATQDYVLTVTTANCVSTDTVRVNINDVPADAGANVDLCYGDSLLLLATGGDSYRWTSQSTLSDSTIANPWAKPLTTKTYTVAVTGGFCTKKDSIKVTVIKIDPDAGPNTQICPGDSIQLQASGGNSYAWIKSSAIRDTTVGNPYVQPASTQTFYVFAKINNCAVKDSVTVTVKSNLVTSAGADLEMCYGETRQLNAVGGTIFNWAPDSTLTGATTANPVASPKVTAQYVLTARSGNCIAYDTINVKVNPLPQVYLGNDTFACKGKQFMIVPPVLFDANIYEWIPANFLDDPASPYPTATLVAPATYKLIATNTFTTCKDSDEVNINVTQANAKFTLSTTVGDAPLTISTLNLSTNEPMQYLWTFKDEIDFYSLEKNPKYTFNVPGEYVIYLEATDQYGCTDTDTATVTVHDAIKVFIPNAFTPNGDRSNEIFKPIYPTDMINSVQGKIWNKWGYEVYSFIIPQDNWWDGKVNGDYAPEGVYIYEIYVTDIYNRTKKYRGSVTLLR